MGGQDDVVDFDDASGGGAGVAADGDDALFGVHVEEAGFVVGGWADADVFDEGGGGVAEFGEPGVLFAFEETAPEIAA